MGSEGSLDQQVLGAETQCARQPNKRQSENHKEHGKARRMFGQAQMPACAQIVAETNLQQSQDSKQTHSGNCDHKPVRHSSCDSFRRAALEATQDAGGLTKSKKGKQPPWRVLSNS
jgi:hypothetical protein